MSHSINRRQFTKSLGVFAATPAVCTAELSSKPRAKVERLGMGAIGMRYQGTVITHKAQAHGDVLAIADVDRHVREQARASFGSTPLIFEDYRDLLARKDVDVILIGTPDHWHAKMIIDACRAGKDVYVEKPLSLTIDEGKTICRVAKETNRVVQVGSWQRSDSRFRLAVEMVRQGRIGRLQHVEVTLAKNPTSGSFQSVLVPKHLNWDLWQGQTPEVPYIEERCHYTFRWWLEYSGGMITDWGAHHIDIADWAIDSSIETVKATANHPNVKDGYNVPTDYDVHYIYENDVTMHVKDSGRNGILFTGSKGRIFVNRGTIAGAPVDRLKDYPLEPSDFALYQHDNLERPQRAGKLDAIVNHMGNFFDCIESRETPISDVNSQHKSVTACHLGNIAMKLNREVQWNASTESFDKDDEANRMMSREQREGFEVE